MLVIHDEMEKNGKERKKKCCKAFYKEKVFEIKVEEKALSIFLLHLVNYFDVHNATKPRTCANIA